MSSPSLPSLLPSLGARLLVTVAALAGLFAMHGLADHGMPSAPLAAATAGTTGTDHGGHHEPEPGAPASHGAAEICLALLGLTFVLVVALSRGGLLLRPSRGTTTRWRALAPRARFRDPPDLFGLSVQRC